MRININGKYLQSTYNVPGILLRILLNKTSNLHKVKEFAWDHIPVNGRDGIEWESTNKCKTCLAWRLTYRKHSRNGSCYDHNFFYHCKCVSLQSVFIVNLSQFGYSESPCDLFLSLQGWEPGSGWQMDLPTSWPTCTSLHAFSKLCMPYLKEAVIHVVIRKGSYDISFPSPIS